MRRFLNTHDSAWRTVDTLLELNPLDIQVLYRELERICLSAKRIPKPPLPRKGFFSRLSGSFGRFQVCIAIPRNHTYNLHLS